MPTRDMNVTMVHIRKTLQYQTLRKPGQLFYLLHEDRCTDRETERAKLTGILFLTVRCECARNYKNCIIAFQAFVAWGGRHRRCVHIPGALTCSGGLQGLHRPRCRFRRREIAPPPHPPCLHSLFHFVRTAHL
jgi:hypothetical protein